MQETVGAEREFRERVEAYADRILAEVERPHRPRVAAGSSTGRTPRPWPLASSGWSRPSPSTSRRRPSASGRAVVDTLVRAGLEGNHRASGVRASHSAGTVWRSSRQVADSSVAKKRRLDASRISTRGGRLMRVIGRESEVAQLLVVPGRTRRRSRRGAPRGRARDRQDHAVAGGGRGRPSPGHGGPQRAAGTARDRASVRHPPGSARGRRR